MKTKTSNFKRKTGKKPPLKSPHKVEGKKRAYAPPQKPGPKGKNQKLETRNQKVNHQQIGLGQGIIGRWGPKRVKYFEAARTLFVDQGISLNAIFTRQLLPIGMRSLSAWCKEGNWRALRDARVQGPPAMVADLEVVLLETLQEIKKLSKAKKVLSGHADVFLKLLKAVQQARGDAHFLGHCVKTQELLMEYLRTTGHEELMKTLLEILPGFTSHVAGMQRT